MVDRNPDRPFRLDAAFVKNVTEPGRYSDGPGAYGLSLLVRATTWGGVTKRFQQRATIDGRRTNLAIGTFPLVTLAQARELALDNARAARRGSAPLAVRVVEREPEPAPVSLAPTFREVEEMFVAANTGAWGRPKTLVDWRARVAAYALPALGDRRVDMVTTADVIDALMPHWVDRHATVAKVAQAVQRVFAFGIARGLCTVNPADAKVLAAAMPRVAKGTKHHEALPYQAVADALVAVQQSSASDAIKLSFEFIALTACRSGEGRGARWDEIDEDTSTWVIPASRMKEGREHRVPLSKAALDVLKRAEPLRDKSGLLFPNAQGGEVHNATLTRLLRTLGVKSTVHGLRSSFADWTAEQGIDFNIGEIALSHAVGNAVTRAYLRSDLIERRREVMEAWAVAALQEPFTT